MYIYVDRIIMQLINFLKLFQLTVISVEKYFSLSYKKIRIKLTELVGTYQCV